MLVYIRGMNIYTSEEELKNIELLHGGHMGASPNNHCTPVLDVFTLDCFTFIVTPICSPVTREMFHRVDDFLQFIGQILLVSMNPARYSESPSYDQRRSLACPIWS